MTHEHLNEAIDRVARAMTAVPADPAFSGRLARRLHRPAPSLAPRLVALPAAAAILVAALIILRSPPSPAVVDRGAVRAPAVAPAVVAHGPETSSASAPAALVAPSSPTRPVRPDDSDYPAPLHVDALTVEPLTFADVDVSPLDVASLELTDIDGGADPKEPK